LAYWGLLRHGKKKKTFLKLKLKQNSNTNRLDCRKSAHIFTIAFVKQDIKVALEEATKAQRERRGIALHSL